jgi:hypothetical protein
LKPVMVVFAGSMKVLLPLVMSWKTCAPPLCCAAPSAYSSA